MGAFDEKPPIILPDPNDPVASEEFRAKWGWEPYEQVIIRGEYTAGDMQQVNDVATTVTTDGDENSVKLQSGTLTLELMRVLILDWTFARNGQKVPVSIHTIRQLPTQYMTPILEVCNKLTNKANMNKKVQEDFLTSANAPTSENFRSAKLRPVK